MRVHAELAVVDRFLIQTGLQPLHHRGCSCQTKQTLRDREEEEKKNGEKEGLSGSAVGIAGNSSEFQDQV